MTILATIWLLIVNSGWSRDQLTTMNWGVSDKLVKPVSGHGYAVLIFKLQLGELFVLCSVYAEFDILLKKVNLLPNGQLLTF